jgi:hypothetical protein
MRAGVGLHPLRGQCVRQLITVHGAKSLVVAVQYYHYLLAQDAAASSTGCALRVTRGCGAAGGAVVDACVAVDDARVRSNARCCVVLKGAQRH